MEDMTRTTFSSSALSGRTVVVTGASSGIGLETALKVASLGARVIGVGRDVERLARLSELLGPGSHQVVHADLAQTDGLEKVFQIVNCEDSVFGLVHAAGGQIVKPMRITKPIDYLSMYEIHVVAAAELMKRMTIKIGIQGEGSFVLLSSVAGFRGSSGVGAYSAAKAALVSLTKTAALELSGQRIRVNCIVPGMVSTPMSQALLKRIPETNRQKVMDEHPLGIGSPSDIAEIAVFLLSDASTWITGASIAVDGGFLAG